MKRRQACSARPSPACPLTWIDRELALAHRFSEAEEHHLSSHHEGVCRDECDEGPPGAWGWEGGFLGLLSSSASGFCFTLLRFHSSAAPGEQELSLPSPSVLFNWPPLHALCWSACTGG